jgi:hypothetical protein
MKKVMTAAFALSALFAESGKVHAEVNYPWCIIGNTRAVDCYFSSREQCAQDGRNRGFGGQCIQNPAYKPGRPPTVSGPVAKRGVSQAARPSQAVSAAATCTSLCLTRGDCSSRGLGADDGGYVCGGDFCNFAWERCMKSGFWSGYFISRQAERR